MNKEISVIEEVRAIKEEIAREHNYDVRALFKSLKRGQEQSGKKIIRLDPKVMTKENNSIVSG